MRVASDSDASAPTSFLNLGANSLALFNAGQVRYRNPCLVIAGTGLQRQEGNVPHAVQSLALEIVELNKLGGVALRLHDVVVLASPVQLPRVLAVPASL